MMKTAFHRRKPGTARQRGAVLIVGLVMLTVMTMLVVSMMKTSILDLKIGGVGQDALVNFSNAEIALGSYFANNTGKFSNNCLTLTGALACNVYTVPTLTGGAVTLTATQTFCGDPAGFTGNQVGTGFQVVVIDALATAVSALGNTMRLHMGVSQGLPVGSC
jgi:Tfp pilus assembly protein PilX